MSKLINIPLSEDEIEYLESIIQSKASKVQSVQKACILLYHAKGVPINIICDMLGLTRSSVIQCIKRYKNSGLKHALGESPGLGRVSLITDEEKAWIFNIVKQRPRNLGCPAEIWTFSRLTQYINEHAEEAGYGRLSTIGSAGIVKLLNKANIKLKRIRYPEHMYPELQEIYNFNLENELHTGK